ncbi:hypothetical protein [Snuella sedimenti]|uniref:Uncharacterized protein n=1 Tax=Snuella sedimenti TaxID=2798802 RepID=A0A8J7LRS0_9FLAO|nr:hypothetical protein [Snuella sedimenti]MBJ6367515.1 hypothetical protein [Snuella sedimenti]
MPITVCSKHSKKSLVEVYQELGGYDNNPVWEIRSKAMTDFIKLINEIFKKTQIWGLTSHDRLVLLTEDNWESNWYVIINNIGNNEYYFEYLIPEKKSPWRNGMVQGVAQSLEEAKKYLLIAMNESEGWKGNMELENLLKDY